jgi:putative Mg2+ transporter-C (MgtC) family protein
MMDELDFLRQQGPILGVQMLAAGFCGSVIGFDRARHDGPAGMKTCMLVCVGATLYAHVGQVLFHSAESGDPGRIAAQIVSGIGFLGAGVILRGNNGVTGLTTAATVWLLGALGIIIGIGYPLSGVGITLIMLLLYAITSRLERWFFPQRAHRNGGVDHV